MGFFDLLRAVWKAGPLKSPSVGSGPIFLKKIAVDKLRFDNFHSPKLLEHLHRPELLPSVKMKETWAC